jgi:hypothetical protein
MKNLILITLSFLLFESCIHNAEKATSIKASQNDSIIFKEPYIKDRLETDSIEVIKKVREKQNGYLVQKVIFLDNKFCNIDKRYVQKEADSIYKNFKFSDYEKYYKDTFVHAINPFPTINSAYLEVKKYNGKYVLSGDDFTLFSMIGDSFIMETSMMEHAFCRIHNFSKEGNVLKLHTGWQIKNFTIEIIELDPSTGLQIWKESDKYSDEYRLKMPLRSALKLPILYRMNNFGEGIEYDIDVDKIDYKSLFNSSRKK